MKRRRSLFDWPFDEFPDFNEIEKMFDEMLKEMPAAKPGKPIVYGFSMNVGPDGKPRFSQFGNVAVPEGKVKNEREPLVDVIEGEKQVTVVAELPGVSRGDVKLRFEHGKLVINVNDPARRYYKEVRIPHEVDERGVEAKLKNGILEIVLPKLRPSKPKEGKVIEVKGD